MLDLEKSFGMNVLTNRETDTRFVFCLF